MLFSCLTTFEEFVEVLLEEFDPVTVVQCTRIVANSVLGDVDGNLRLVRFLYPAQNAPQSEGSHSQPG